MESAIRGGPTYAETSAEHNNTVSDSFSVKSFVGDGRGENDAAIHGTADL